MNKNNEAADGRLVTPTEKPDSPAGTSCFGRQFLLSALVGIAAGGGAIVFYVALQSCVALVQHGVLGYSPPEVLGEPPVIDVALRPAIRWLWLIVPPLGALLGGLIVWKWAPEAEGHGTDAAIEAYHTRDGYIRERVPLIKCVSSAIVIGSGGSGGREGPIAQIGAGVGSWLGRRLGLPAAERRALMAAGMGAGVGAIFRAPLAGALFASEILYSSAELEPEVLMPAIVASITAFVVFSSVFGSKPLFRVVNVGFSSGLELVPYSVLAVLAALTGMLYTTSFYGAVGWFHRLPGPAWAKPALGGVMTGCVGFFVPGAAFTGYGEVQEALLGHRSAGLLLTLALLRIVTTSTSIGSGGSGGIFGPSMVIGGCLGGAVGMFFHQSWPWLAPNPAAFVIVGMAGFFAGVAHAPISTVVMVSEITGDYNLLAPAMWVCAISFLMTKNFKLYHKQVQTRRHSPAHASEFVWTFLDGLHVVDCMGRAVISFKETQPMSDVARIVAEHLHHHYPVLDESGNLAGVFDVKTLQELSLEDALELQPQPLRDFVRGPAHTITPGSTLFEAAARLVSSNVEMLVVTQDSREGPVLGVLTRADLLRAHDRRFGANRASTH